MHFDARDPVASPAARWDVIIRVTGFGGETWVPPQGSLISNDDVYL